MSRSLKKGSFCDYKIIKKIDYIILNKKKKFFKTWSRKSTILSEFVGFTIAVHNGRKHVPVYINSEMIGHKLGEFVLTRTFKGHSALKKDKKFNFIKKKKKC